MAYDDGLAQRIREALDEEPAVVEKKMFGGIVFMIRDHMSVGVVGEELMVRVGPDAYAGALALPHAREMDFTGRALKGFVYVGVEGLEDDAELGRWVERGAAHSRALPPKSPKTAKTLGSKRKPQARQTSKTARKVRPKI